MHILKCPGLAMSMHINIEILSKKMRSKREKELRENMIIFFFAFFWCNSTCR